MNTLFLSIVIPTYNRVSRLKLTLDGLARQTWPMDRFEVLVVSDGSTDETESMVRAFAASVPYPLHLCTQTNSGPSRARNQGIRQATGDVIVFLDDDVEPMPGLLAAHAARHEGDDCVSVVGPMLPDPRRRRSEPPWIAWEHDMLQKQYANWQNGFWSGAGPHHFYSGNASVRREHLTLAGGFDERFVRQEDVELAYRMSRDLNMRFVYEAKAVGIHRPSRSFLSWLAIPAAYGKLDVVRARQGNASWDIVRHGYYGRSRPTRILADATMTIPALAVPVQGVLLAGAQVCHRAGLTSFSRGALSVLYNLRYLAAARTEIGSRNDLYIIMHS